MSTCMQVYIRGVSGDVASPDAPGTPPARPAGAARAVRYVYTAAVESVVSEAADYVPLSDLVVHISTWHGKAAVGQFRSLLTGLLR